MKRNFSTYLKPLLVILLIVQFFRLNILYSNLSFIYSGYKTILLFIFLFVILFNKKRIKYSELVFSKLLVGYFIFIVINCFTCLYFRGQPLSVSILAWTPFFPLFFYPCFKSLNLPTDTWEKILMTLFLMVLLGYLLQTIFTQYQLFQLDVSWEKFVRTERVRIKSDGILFLGLFFSWNKFLCTRNKLLLLLSFVAFLMVFLQGYRILIVATIIVCVLLYYKIIGLKRNILLLLLIIPIAVDFSLRFDFINEKIEEIIERNEDQNFENEDYVRVIDLEYFYNDHFLSNTEMVLGSGMPILAIDSENNDIKRTNNTSDYSLYMSQLAAFYHMYTVDLGILGLSWIAGIPFTLLLVILLLGIYRMNVEKEYMYLGGYCLLTLLCGFTNGLLYKGFDIVYIALILVIIDSIQNKKRLLQNGNSIK